MYPLSLHDALPICRRLADHGADGAGVTASAVVGIAGGVQALPAAERLQRAGPAGVLVRGARCAHLEGGTGGDAAVARVLAFGRGVAAAVARVPDFGRGVAANRLAPARGEDGEREKGGQ